MITFDVAFTALTFLLANETYLYTMDLPAPNAHLVIIVNRLHLADTKAVCLETHGRKQRARRHHDKIDQGDAHNAHIDCFLEDDHGGKRYRA